MNFKAQGTIEYLIILAAVIVLTLFVITTAMDVLPSIGVAPSSSSKSEWSKGTPIALVDWTISQNGQMLIVIKNNSYGKIGLKGFYLSENDSNTDIVPIIEPGAQYTITIAPSRYLGGCTIGTNYAFNKLNIRIDYNTSFSQELTQNAPTDITGSC
ncbi:MAG: hypothetical protein WCI04_01280 [archaeon]